jgi:hypothetical protein
MRAPSYRVDSRGCRCVENVRRWLPLLPLFKRDDDTNDLVPPPRTEEDEVHERREIAQVEQRLVTDECRCGVHHVDQNQRYHSKRNIEGISRPFAQRTGAHVGRGGWRMLRRSQWSPRKGEKLGNRSTDLAGPLMASRNCRQATQAPAQYQTRKPL